MAAPAHTAPHHGRTHHHPNYLMIFWWLAILTVLEVGVIFMPIPRMTINVLLGAFALVKAALVAAYFMHLRFEVADPGAHRGDPAGHRHSPDLRHPSGLLRHHQADREEEARAGRATAPAPALAPGLAHGGWPGWDEQARAARALRRALALRCPRCGATPLFPGRGLSRWFAMAPRCAAVRAALRARPGLLGGRHLRELRGDRDHRPGRGASPSGCVAGISTAKQLWFWLPFVVLFPLWFFRYSRSLWLAVELMLNPEP